MKLVLMTLVAALISTSAMAADKIVCREQSGKKITVVVSPGEQLAVGANEDLDSRSQGIIEVYTKNVIISDIAVEGVIETEDVMYSFVSKNKKVSLRIFLDEMDQTTLTLNGKDYSLVCY